MVRHRATKTKNKRPFTSMIDPERLGFLIRDGVLARLQKDDARQLRDQGRHAARAGQYVLFVDVPFPEGAIRERYDATKFFNWHPFKLETPSPEPEAADAVQLVAVPFDGDTLQAIQEDGKVWVSVRRVCEGIGIKQSDQIDKIKRRSWAVVRQSRTTGTDGKTYQMTMVDLETLGMWLATIDERRVSEAARPKVIRYQAECKKAIAKHFGLAKANTSTMTSGQMVTLEMAAMLHKQTGALIQEAQIARQEREVLASRLTAVEGALATGTDQAATIQRLETSLQGARQAYSELAYKMLVFQQKWVEQSNRSIGKQADAMKARAKADEVRARNEAIRAQCADINQWVDKLVEQGRYDNHRDAFVALYKHAGVPASRSKCFGIRKGESVLRFHVRKGKGDKIHRTVMMMADAYKGLPN